MSGWVKIHRSALDSRVIKNKDLWQLWCWILMSVNYKESWADENTKVGPGQMLVGRESIGTALKVRPGTIYDRLKKLEQWKMITLKSNSRGTVLTVCNWTTYQSRENEIQQPTNSQPTANQQPTNNQPTLIKKGKKGKKGKNNNSRLFDDLEIIDQIYKSYPRREAPIPAKKAIAVALEKVDAELLLKAVQEYAEAKKDTPKKYIKLPATWFNAGCWDDDRESWADNQNQGGGSNDRRDAGFY